MKQITDEFEAFLKELVETYPKATTNILDNPSSLGDVGSKSRDFNAKINTKINELSAKYNIPVINLKVDLASLITSYSGKLMRGHL